MRSNPLKPTPTSRIVYWERTRRLTLLLLLVWLAVTFGVIFFARELSSFTVFGWPFSFYMAAQGTILVYVAIVAVYAWSMRRLDKTLIDDDTHGE